MKPKSMINNITDVKGFSCWGAHIGLKAKRRDLAMIFSEVPARTVAVYTRNIVIAEPLKVTKEHLKDGIAQAIVINSGNANACTGEQGREGAQAMASTMAEMLKIKKEDVVVASTGVIGRIFPTEKIVAGIKENVGKLSKKRIAGSFTANAILTTDTFPKEDFLTFEIGGQTVNMAGIAKGSGMIHPNMGTMLAFIVCDVAIEYPLLDKIFKEAIDKSFNMVTVDGDTSTNDMCILMCNGMAGNKIINSETSEDFRIFKEKVEEICLTLAKLIVSDGEGATKFVEYKVINAPDEQMARQIIRTIAGSSLVKTALFGQDPNWGRIIAAAGRSGVMFDPEKINLHVGASELVQMLKDGRPTYGDLDKLKELMKDPHLNIILDLNAGHAEATGWGTDLSLEYVKFNAEYTT